MWSAVLAPGLPHSAQMVALPSLSSCLRLALYVGSLYGDDMSLMLLPPLLRCGWSLACSSLGGLCSPQFRVSSSWLPDTGLKWTPFVFMTFRRCTSSYPSSHSSK